MPQIIVSTRGGNEHTVDASSGFSLMESIRETGDLMALCGGMCSCATCHVYIASTYKALLPPISDDEDGLLDASEHRRESSRLSCQIRLTEAMDGMRVTIAPED